MRLTKFTKVDLGIEKRGAGDSGATDGLLCPERFRVQKNSPDYFQEPASSQRGGEGLEDGVAEGVDVRGTDKNIKGLNRIGSRPRFCGGVNEMIGKTWLESTLYIKQT